MTQAVLARDLRRSFKASRRAAKTATIRVLLHLNPKKGPYRSRPHAGRAFRGAQIPSGEAALLCEWSQIKRLAPKLRLLKASFAIVSANLYDEQH
jgi:hypothetical protein